MDQCVFCKIAHGKIKVIKSHEDELTLAFTPKNEISKGHTLIIPKDHYESLFDIPEDLLQKVIILTKKISLKLKTEMGATGVNLLHASGEDAQQSVSHFHIHIVPRHPNDGLDLWIKSGIEKQKHNP